MSSTETDRLPRVVMLLGSLPPMPVGGAEMQAMQLYKALRKKGLHPQVITWGKFWNKKHDEYAGVKFVRVKSLFNLVIDLPSVFKRKPPPTAATKIVYDDKKDKADQMAGKVWTGMVLRYKFFYINCLAYLWLRRNTFDIIHVHMMEWPAVVAVQLGKKLNKPVVIKDSTMNGIFNLLRYPDGVVKQKEIAAYAHCVAMTRAIHSNYIKAGIPEHRIADIPNGIRITPPPARDRIWTHRVIFVGNLTQQPAKGIDILLFAWKQVKHAVSGASLRIVGDGNLRSYRDFVNDQGIGSSVEFMGRQSDVRSLMSDADVFVLPSRREGMSNALMEAMLAAMPVVATDVSGSQDLIEDGVSGLLVPVADVDRLAAALIYMLTNHEHALAMGRMAYNTIKEKCDLDKVADQYVSFYKKIMEKP